MQISNRQIPQGTKIIRHREPVANHAGIIGLSPVICSAFARWGIIEKKLNQLYSILTDGDASKRQEFDRQKGWDRRFSAVVDAAYAAMDADEADFLKAALKLAESSASKRHELAHNVWATAEGFDDDLLLLPPDDQHITGLMVAEAKRTGSSKVQPRFETLYAGSRLVGRTEMFDLIAELDRAEDRIDNIMYAYIYPTHAFVEEEFQEQHREAISKDTALQDRARAIKRGRRPS